MRRIALVLSLLLVAACTSNPGSTVNDVPATIAQAVQATLTARPTLRPSPTRPSPTPLPPSPTPTVTPYSPQPLPPAQAWPSDVTQVLPAPLYYLSDVTGNQQIWRLETNGASGAMLTNLPQSVDAYDVSPATGHLAYISNNQLSISDALSHDPQPIDTQNEDLSSGYGSVAWSPDGTRLFFTGQSGLWIYTVASQTTVRWMARPDDVNGLQITMPQPWSPDGQTLLINSLSADWGEVNYLPLDGSTSLIRIDLSICDEVRWSLDGRSLYGSRDSLGGPCGNPGLDRWEMGSQTATPLIASEPITQSQRVLARFVRAAQEGPDGFLYYFYDSEDTAESVRSGTLSMVRSAPDGLTDRLALRSDSYANVYEALWAPDMSVAVVVVNVTHNEKWQAAGTLILLTTDNKPARSLPGHGSRLRWGKAE